MRVTERTLYVIVCAAPPARERRPWWTLRNAPAGRSASSRRPRRPRFIDVPALAASTRHAVRSDYKRLGEPDVLPAPDAIVVAPATFNTIDKWAAGISDTLSRAVLPASAGSSPTRLGHQRTDSCSPASARAFVFRAPR
jgi:flavoprotein